MDSPIYGNFGDEMNNVLNRIGNYCREKGYTAEQAIQVFDAGIFARSAFFPVPAVQEDESDRC